MSALNRTEAKSREATMSITDTQATMIAETMRCRLGEAAVAAAMLKAQQAQAVGDLPRTADWRVIAEKLVPTH